MDINNYKTYQCNSPLFKSLPSKYKEVDKYLIRGPYPHIADVFRLKKEGVNKIYDFRHVGLKGFKWAERITCKLAGIEYIRKPYDFLKYKFPTQAEYEALSKDVKENGERGGKTLFHCNSGTHRTSLISAFYDITKGKPLNECKMQDENFNEKVKNIIDKHIVQFRYFSRNRVENNTKNPIKFLKNVFNNKVEKATRKAYEIFVEMTTKEK